MRLSMIQQSEYRGGEILTQLTISVAGHAMYLNGIQKHSGWRRTAYPESILGMNFLLRYNSGALGYGAIPSLFITPGISKTH